MNDEQIIRMVAELWVANGRDADDIDFLKEKIKEAVDKLLTLPIRM